ncbi:MAG: glucose-6-phosphate isomerase family protein, partial [Chloroflexota bacterium]
IYVVTSGKGGMLLSDRSGNCQFIEMVPGNLYYVPGNFAHRTLNIGSEEFAFLCIWPPDIIHDYESIAKNGFPKLIMSSQTGYTVMDNPRFSLA